MKYSRYIPETLNRIIPGVYAGLIVTANSLRKQRSDSVQTFQSTNMKVPERKLPGSLSENNKGVWKMPDQANIFIELIRNSFLRLLADLYIHENESIETLHIQLNKRSPEKQSVESSSLRIKKRSHYTGATILSTIKTLAPILISMGLLISCSDNSPSNHVSEKDINNRQQSTYQEITIQKNCIMLEKPQTVSRGFNLQIQSLYDQYIEIELALAETDTAAANAAAFIMKALLDLVPEPSQKPDAKKAWGNQKDGFEENLTKFLNSKNIDTKRVLFSHLSEILYCTLKSFEVDVGDVHVVYCKESFGNKGAYWLTHNHEIKNPYLGNRLPTCGTITEIIP